LLEKPPLERFTVLDICKVTAKWFVSCSLLLAEKKQKEQMKWQIESIMRTFSLFLACGLAMVLREAHSVLTSRIYKNGAQRSASLAVLPDSEWSIPMIQIKFPPFSTQSVHPSVNLPSRARSS
jgi:regulation of enolase protein 1 (concanavalin A-like superfamily)